MTTLVLFIYYLYTIYLTRLASKEIFSPSNKIHRAVSWAKDLSAPLYLHTYILAHIYILVYVCVCVYIYIYTGIILRWIFRKWEGVVRTGWSWLRIGTGGGHL